MGLLYILFVKPVIDEVYRILRPTLEKGGLFFMTQMSLRCFTPKQKYDKVVQIKMTNDNYEYLKFCSKKLEISMSEIIRESLFLYLNNHL